MTCREKADSHHPLWRTQRLPGSRRPDERGAVRHRPHVRPDLAGSGLALCRLERCGPLPVSTRGPPPRKCDTLAKRVTLPAILPASGTPRLGYTYGVSQALGEPDGHAAHLGVRGHGIVKHLPSTAQHVHRQRELRGPHLVREARQVPALTVGRQVSARGRSSSSARPRISSPTRSKATRPQTDDREPAPARYRAERAGVSSRSVGQLSVRGNVTSTLRFFLRPASVELSAIGYCSP